ncbi:hypothetical protein LCGC14_2726820, partial [marine sediment metagenome]
MKVVLVPGLTAHVSYLSSLRERLERDGHEVCWPGFSVTTLVRDELQQLLATVDATFGQVAVVGHSAGGLLAVMASQARGKPTVHKGIHLVIGMGTPLVGDVKLGIPHYEARSVIGWLMPLCGPEVKRFFLSHSALPIAPETQDWVADILSWHPDPFTEPDKWQIPCWSCGIPFSPGITFTSGYCRECHAAGTTDKRGRWLMSAELVKLYKQAP